ncbi:MAG TPA: hydrogenase maturation nickel metallochaperone HypA [Anaerolineaceae bacterium]|nr:hydrogenase maturation nickel metallochaperone HypA [Anaerolineaceae bacterium]
MHELAVTEEILRKAEQIAEQEQADKVTEIFLEIGRLSGIVDESVQFYWDEISKNTVCAGAVLHFKITPASLICKDCGKEYELDHDLIPCPACSGMNIKITGGDEFILTSIEIEK